MKVNDITSVGANDEQEYLKTEHMQAKKVRGKVRGHNAKNNYGDDDGQDNAMYSQRGTGTSDEKKLEKQAKPNDRMYMYVQ